MKWVVYWLNCVEESQQTIGTIDMASRSPSLRRLPRWHTYVSMESVAVKVPILQKLDPIARALSPWIAVHKRRKDGESDNTEDQEYGNEYVADDGARTETERSNAVGNEVEQLTERHDSEVERGKVVMQEELTGHEIKGEVVEGPPENSRTQLVIKAFEGHMLIIIAAALPSQSGNSLEQDVNGDCGRRRPPYQGISEKVDLTMVTAPEIDTTTEDRPRWRSRIPCVRLNQTRVGGPHHLLQFEKLTQEARIAVIDFLRVRR